MWKRHDRENTNLLQLKLLLRDYDSQLSGGAQPKSKQHELERQPVRLYQWVHLQNNPN